MYSILLDPEEKKETQTNADSCEPSLPIVFAYDKRSQTFNRTFYYSGLTDRRASYEDIHYFLLKIEVLIHNKLKAVECLVAFYIIFALLTFGLILFFDFTTESKDLICLVTLGYFVALICCGVALLMTSRRKYRLIRAQAQEIVDDYSEMFASVGLRWLLPANFPMQVELHKDYEALDFEPYTANRGFNNYREGAQRQYNNGYRKVNITNHEINPHTGL